MNNTDAFILGLLTLTTYLVLDLNWYSSFYMWIILISACLPLLIICINLIPLYKLKATMTKFSCCKKSHYFKMEGIEGEESAIDDDRCILTVSLEES